jgi:hypothetical protein
VAGIGNGRSSRVAHERYLGTLLELDHYLRRAREFVVLVVADEPFGNVEVRKKLQRLPRVFAGDYVRFLQYPQRPERDVLEVADGSRDHVEATCPCVARRRLKFFPRHCINRRPTAGH